MARRKASIKVSRVFGLTLGLVSIIGFLAIVLESLLNVDFLTQVSEALILMILGLGLIFEGKLFKLFRTAKDGISSSELAKWVTAIVGILVFIAGTLTLIGVNNETLNVVKGISALIATVILVLEVFFNYHVSHSQQHGKAQKTHRYSPFLLKDQARSFRAITESLYNIGGLRRSKSPLV